MYLCKLITQYVTKKTNLEKEIQPSKTLNKHVSPFIDELISPSTKQVQCLVKIKVIMSENKIGKYTEKNKA